MAAGLVGEDSADSAAEAAVDSEEAELVSVGRFYVFTEIAGVIKVSPVMTGIKERKS